MCQKSLNGQPCQKIGHNSLFVKCSANVYNANKISKCLSTLFNVRIIRTGGALDKSWNLLFSPDSYKSAF